jgi:hypothetical protein
LYPELIQHVLQTGNYEESGGKISLDALGYTMRIPLTYSQTTTNSSTTTAHHPVFLIQRSALLHQEKDGLNPLFLDAQKYLSLAPSSIPLESETDDLSFSSVIRQLVRSSNNDCIQKKVHVIIYKPPDGDDGDDDDDETCIWTITVHSGTKNTSGQRFLSCIVYVPEVNVAKSVACGKLSLWVMAAQLLNAAIGTVGGELILNFGRMYVLDKDIPNMQLKFQQLNDQSYNGSMVTYLPSSEWYREFVQSAQFL